MENRKVETDIEKVAYELALEYSVYKGMENMVEPSRKKSHNKTVPADIYLEHRWISTYITDLMYFICKSYKEKDAAKNYRRKIKEFREEDKEGIGTELICEFLETSMIICEKFNAGIERICAEIVKELDTRNVFFVPSVDA